MIRDLILSAQEGDKWWLAGGIHPSQVVAAYQPKGAVDLAASYVNLANPGTHDAAVGVAPTLESSGWVFNGADQYLIGPPSNSAGFAVNFSNVTNTGAIVGARTVANVEQIYFRPSNGIGEHVYSNTSGSAPVLTIITPALSSGVVIINSVNGALNGSIEASSMTADISAFYPYYIGAANANGTLGLLCAATIQACCFFASGTTLTPAQIAALSAAMAAL